MSDKKRKSMKLKEYEMIFFVLYLLGFNLTGSQSILGHFVTVVVVMGNMAAILN